MEPCEEVHAIQGNCLLLNKPINLHVHQRHSKLTLLHDAPIYVIAADIDVFHITKSIELIPGKWSTDSQRRLITFERF